MAAMSLTDRAILAFDRALRTVCTNVAAQRPSPAEAHPEAGLDETQRKHAAALMRVNHAGEVAAQALYQGQAATARLEAIRAAMDRAADEENDHLAWCEQRVRELGARTSLLNPAWYAGSFAIGALAGLAGDEWSLGFIAETERQVVRHLDDHLQRLPETDDRSRAVIEQMKIDEADHGTAAAAAGGRALPGPVRAMMGIASRVMTTTAYRV